MFLVLELLLVSTVGGDSMWAPVRMIGAIALGEAVLPPPATFDLGVLLAALAVHFVLAIVYGIIFAALVSMLKLGDTATIIAGLVFGLALYAVNFYVFTAQFPWFEMARNWMSIVAHAAFGLVLGWAYNRFARRSFIERAVGI